MRLLTSLIILLFWAQSTTAATVYDSILIIANDNVITRNEVEIRVYELASRSRIDMTSASQVEKLRSTAIDQLIEEVLLEDQAKKLMVRIPDEELDVQIDQFRKKRNLTQIQFEELLEQQRISLSDFRKNFKKQLLRNQVISREIRSKISITDEQLKLVYDKRAKLVTRVHARHILLLLKPNAPSTKVDEVRTKIIGVKKMIESGTSFQEIADKYSEDPSAKNNHGDLGFFEKEDMVTEFSEVAFKLAQGTISEPVRTSFGFHLIEVLEKKAEAGQEFSKVKNKLHQQEYQMIFKQEYQNYIKDLKEDARIVKR